MPGLFLPCGLAIAAGLFRLQGFGLEQFFGQGQHRFRCVLGQPQPQLQPQGSGQVGRQAPGLGNGAVGCGEVTRVQRQFGVGHVPGQLGRGTEVGQPRQVGVALFGVLHGVAGACGDQQGQRAVVFQRLVVQRFDRFALGFLVTALEKGQRALAQGRAGRAELAFALVVAHAVRQGQRHTKGPQDQVKRQQGGDGQHHHQVERQLHPVGREHQDGVAWLMPANSDTPTATANRAVNHSTSFMTGLPWQVPPAGPGSGPGRP